MSSSRSAATASSTSAPTRRVPIATDKLAAGFSMAFSQRDGFTKNTYPQPVTRSDAAIDSREGFSAKGQLLWTPQPAWEVRAIIAGERARDGDYALNDLEAVRQQAVRSHARLRGFHQSRLVHDDGHRAHGKPSASPSSPPPASSTGRRWMRPIWITRRPLWRRARTPRMRRRSRKS